MKKNNKNNKISKGTIIGIAFSITILLVSLIIILILLPKQKEEIENEDELMTVGRDEISNQINNNNNNIVYEKELTKGKVDWDTDYWAIKKILLEINRYILFAQNGDAENLIEYLDKNYLNENNISEADLIDISKSYGTNEPYLKELNYEEITQKITIFEAITNNGTFYIKTEKENQDDNKIKYSIMLKLVENEKKLQEDLLEDSKVVEYGSLTQKEIAKDLYIRFVNTYYQNKEEAYKLVNERYKQFRFKTIEEFKNYMDSIRFNTEGDISCTEIENDEYTQIDMRDSLGNALGFRYESCLKYSVFLDTYLFGSQGKGDNYIQLNDEEKVKQNIYEYFQMINTYDFESAYNYLRNETKEKFNSIDSYKEYLSKNLYKHNIVRIEKKENERSKDKLYQYLCTITNQENESEAKYLNMLVELEVDPEDNTSYQVSLSIKEN